MTAEQLISDLQLKCLKLKDELLEAQQDIKDFEKAAVVWKKAYGDMEKSYQVKMVNLVQTIEELEKELDAWKHHKG